MKGYSSSTRLELVRFVRKSSEGGELITHLQNGGRRHVVVIVAQHVCPPVVGELDVGEANLGLDFGSRGRQYFTRRALAYPGPGILPAGWSSFQFIDKVRVGPLCP